MVERSVVSLARNSNGHVPENSESISRYYLCHLPR